MSRFIRLLSTPHSGLSWMEKIWISVLAIAILMTPFLAHAMNIPGKNPNCEYNETAQISLNYNESNTDLDLLEKNLEKKLTALEETAKKVGITKLDLNSYNLNFSLQNISSYQASASVGYTISPYEKAKALVTAIKDLNLQPSLSLSVSQNGCS